MVEEIFGPVLTVSTYASITYNHFYSRNVKVYVYEDANFEQTLDLVNATSAYALTGSMSVDSI